MPVHTSRPRAATVAFCVMVATACSVFAGDDSTGTTPAPTSAPTSTDTTPTAGTRVRAAPWSARPTVSLRFDVPAGLSVVRGRETVRFTPDRRICRLVFRAWPNKPETARAGNALTVTHVLVDGSRRTPRVSSAGAPSGTPGTLVSVPLRRCVRAGGAVNTDLRFRLRLGAGSRERVGYSPAARVAWFATAFPLLAWERGRGWALEPAVDVPGETTTSEDFRLDRLEVVAPNGYDVLGTGRALPPKRDPSAGTTTHRFRANAVRDVAVSVGDLRTTTRSVGPTRIHVGGATIGTRTALGVWADLTATAVGRVSELLGPMPYADLWVTVVPVETTGIEFPGAILFGDIDPVSFTPLVSHEVAHMWFYGLVGDNQARDPWLDESFATWAQAVVDGEESRYLDAAVPVAVRGELGASMTSWAGQSDLYSAGVYLQGAQALLRGREAVGADRFDAAVRAYLDANAHRIATPTDVRRAFAELPDVLEELDSAGAFGGG